MIPERVFVSEMRISIRCSNRVELAPVCLVPICHFNPVSLKTNSEPQGWLRTGMKVLPVLFKQSFAHAIPNAQIVWYESDEKIDTSTFKMVLGSKRNDPCFHHSSVVPSTSCHILVIPAFLSSKDTVFMSIICVCFKIPLQLDQKFQFTNWVDKVNWPL